ncbi:MAG: RIP metalloprotease RseP [Clostridiales Family XIII bacterium]|jgi:regulator of sigma E protease|nr:RIP metalloprotease RseP [Clostridiales Family XIII bacterium]
MTIVYAIIIFCLLIFAHEFGHLTAAKAVGVRVNAFALGMGPRLLHFKRGDTEYSLRAFPIGGFCAMEGEDESSDDPRSFGCKPLPAKALVLLAGSLMNVLLAVLILSAVIFANGTPSTVISEVGAGSPAEAAGVLPGDRIVSVDGRAVTEWEDIPPAVVAAKGDRVAIVVLRDGEELRLESGFYTGDDGLQKIGVTPGTERRVRSIGPALLLGCRAAWNMGTAMVQAIGMLFTGGVSVQELTGPVGIVYIVGDVAKNGMLQLAQLTALISLNLGIVNLLPIPALDGCRFLFLFIRKLTGKAMTDEMEGKVHFVGIMLLFALMIFVTFQDVARFVF